LCFEKKGTFAGAAQTKKKDDEKKRSRDKIAIYKKGCKSIGGEGYALKAFSLQKKRG